MTEINPVSKLALAQNVFFTPFQLDQKKLSLCLDRLLGPSIDFADLYFQTSESEAWILDEGIVKEASSDQGQGVGIRILGGEKTGFAYSNDISESAILEAAQMVSWLPPELSPQKNKKISAFARRDRVEMTTKKGWFPAYRQVQASSLYPSLNPLQSMTAQEKVAFLQRIDRLARSLDPHITQVTAALDGSFDVILIAGSDGTLVADIRPLVHFGVTVIVESHGRREIGSCGGGGRGDYKTYCSDAMVAHCVQEAVRKALLNLDAIQAPAGIMPVVLGPGFPAVLLHESIGHGLEGDFNRKETSAFSHRMNTQVASKACTIVDDGTIPGRSGSIEIDDEGTVSQRTVLIENGILKNYLQDKLNAHLMGLSPTGNGRRESYAHIPLPRMTNTYLLPGHYDPQEIIASVEKGLYIADLSGGQVDITSGKFVFSTSEAYVIEKGRVTQPVKGASLIGHGPDILTKISMVGNDLEFDSGVGTCGKDGQSIPVGVGQPTVKIDAMTVGGTEL